MNTVAVGDFYEERSYELNEKAIKDETLGISPKDVKLFRNKRFHSILLENGIVVDLSYEI